VEVRGPALFSGHAFQEMPCHQAHFLACAIPLLLEAGEVGFKDLSCPGLRAELCLADPDVGWFGQRGF